MGDYIDGWMDGTQINGSIDADSYLRRFLHKTAIPRQGPADSASDQRKLLFGIITVRRRGFGIDVKSFTHSPSALQPGFSCYRTKTEYHLMQETTSISSSC